MTGAASGVLIVAGSMFRPRTIKALAADLGIAERRPLLLVSEDPFLLGVVLPNASTSLPGCSSGTWRASSARNSPGAPFSAAGHPSR